MQRTVGRVWSAFLNTNGIVLSAGGVIISVLSWVVPLTDSSVPIRVVIGAGVPLVVLAALLLIALVNAIYVLLREGTEIPKAIYGTKDQDGRPIVLLESSVMFTHDAAVSVYFRNAHDFEELVGYGVVRNIQQDGKIQVLFEIVGATEEASKVMSNDKAILERIRVKPTIPRSALALLGSKPDA
ncbi:MAG: hypothetical protein IPG45_27915 [Deltaproteobacteria bacterium]|nr:hypothetical protein [Deltaproteobacteria bacterium]